ncbi:MAG: alpha/beta hydrolase [Blastomonas fulva]|uniref:lipase family protein n=1 Tax=Blastomonas fulva TaxID=1550728 RepID=UPI0024E1CE04|nr:lipase family protein [Blastomonas fulva]MDK2757317.1 alpha/beta hydrolase [Blastomonas fulva]
MSRTRPRWIRNLLFAGACLGLANPLAAQSRMPLADPQLGDGGTGAFYQWDGDVPTGAPRIVRREAMAPDKALAQAGSSERVLYTSRGGPDGTRSIVVSGGVYLPRGLPPRGGWPVIAWAHGTVGFPDICAPSFNGWSARDTAYLNTWLQQGYAVVASDYEGLGTNGAHPYMMSRSEGQGVLDAVLAARKRYPLSRNLVLVGQSQGAHAATNAALMQSGVARTLRLRGVVLTGWPGSMEMSALDMQKFDGWAALYMRFLPTYAFLDPGIKPQSMLTPAGKIMYERFRSTCGSDGMRRFMAERPVAGTLFTQDPTPLEARAKPYREYPPLAFKVPVFVGIGLSDEQTDPRTAFDGAKRACALGANVAIHMYPGLEHGPTVPKSQEDSLPWVRQAFEGNVPKGNCAEAEYPSATP